MKYTILVFVFLLIALLLISNIAYAENETRTPIKHVIIIFMENHSFDNFFGVYPTGGVNESLSNELMKPNNLLGLPVLSQLKPVPNGTYVTVDPNEGYIPYHQDWNGGKMDGFLQGSGPQGLTYYTVSQLAPLWDLAEEYGLADNYFSPVMSESAPNHLYLYAAYSPVIDDYGPPPYIPFNETIFAELSQYGVSWGYYIFNASDWGQSDLKYFSGVKDYLNHVRSWSTFIDQLNNGTLPSVSWILPSPTTDMGPPANVLQGEMWLLYIVNAIMRSPEWISTAIFITFDEAGGYYDHVPPPVFQGQQLGERVPLIVISPYSKEDYISNTLLTHASLIAFIDYNWGLPALNKFVLNSYLPLDFFNFTQPPRPPVNMSGFPIPSSPYFTFNNSVVQEYSNLGKLFPLPPQIPFNKLGCPRSGSTNLTLASISSKVYVTNNVSYTPLPLTPQFLLLIGGIQLLAAIVSQKYSLRESSKLFRVVEQLAICILGFLLISSMGGSILDFIGVINYGGYVGESIPILEGLIIGVLVLSVVGYLLSKFIGSFWLPILLTVVLPIIDYIIFYLEANQIYVFGDTLLGFGAFLSASPSILISFLVSREFSKRRWVLILVLVILSSLITVVIANEYIALGQPGISTLLLPITLITIPFTAVFSLIKVIKVKVAK
ncbi:phosphoesterase [Sulfolobus acidocaldarius SUSAZ]|nr:phosphoesterase [Sulfolobus acidocaldarius SUSAZ]